MFIKINQRDLSQKINIVQKAVSTRSTLPILDGILLEAKNNQLKLTATDLEIGIETKVECNVIEEGSIVLDSRIFGDIVKKLPDSEISLKLSNQDRNVNIVCQNSEFNILASNPKDYPELPTIINKNSFRLSKDLFKDAIRQTVFATSKDETRPILTGVLLEVRDNIGSFVSLDGYRLALKNINIDSSQDIEVVIPAKALVELNKIIEDKDEELEVILAPKHIIFKLEDTLFSSRLLEGQFLNYRDIIRKEHKTTVFIDKTKFQNSLERASLLAKEEKANLIKLRIEDNLLTINSNSEIGDVNEEILSTREGEDLNIAFNARYILEGIKTIDVDKIKLQFSGSLSPCIIQSAEDDNYTYLVLPVRIAQDEY